MLDSKMHEKKILKLSTLKRSTSLNRQQLREEHDEALNTANYNCTTESIGQNEKLRQTSEDRKGEDMEIGEERDIIRK